jgi:hypothetical protein
LAEVRDGDDAALDVVAIDWERLGH